ncbi:MAG: cupin domain-containing protein [Gammaproteobacteria bacterium]|nr:cupin domain-containing protein [Gammaproteobacteria bacterium]
MKTQAAILALAGLLVSVLDIAVLQASEHKAYKPEVKSETLVEETLASDDSKTVIIKRFTLPRDYVGARHYHSGAVYVYVLDGEFTIETEGQGQQTFKAGQLYREPAGRVMRARNLRSDGNLEILVFQVGEAGKPMMIKAD